MVTRRRAAGFTMIEMLAVVAILAIMISATVGVAGSLRSSRGMTGVHQMAAACDAARARAMKEQREVLLAFARASDGDMSEGRAVLVCAAPLLAGNDLSSSPEEEASRQRDCVLEPLTEWIHLPEGHYFSDTNPAMAGAGVNFLNLADTERPVRLPDGRTVSLKCIGFGSLGEVVFPETAPTNGSPLLIAISEQAEADQVSAQDCRWIGIQSHSGAPMILP